MPEGPEVEIALPPQQPEQPQPNFIVERYVFKDPLSGDRVTKSFGSMRIIFTYLTQIEVTHMQQCSRWFYDKAVSRC